MARLALALLTVAALATAAPVPKVRKVVPFAYAVGTRWEYVCDGDKDRVWVEEVVECESKGGVVTFKVAITTDSGVKKVREYRMGGGELAITGTHEASLDPPLVIAKAGMKAGDEWVAKWARMQEGVRTDHEATLTVGEAEEISTPAGKFTAYPIRRTRDENDSPFSAHWYADGIGMIRMTHERQQEPIRELKAFTPGKK